MLLFFFDIKHFEVFLGIIFFKQIWKTEGVIAKVSYYELHSLSEVRI